ncbi:hypothetical protein L6452_25549 [Arctium lappa]|uniref:Uncharacterized protein n=1 Tax=Arctium lappa TaxID=4217 RepID=A0ACB9AB47_ARCLA|nr:hypothetical protein L6452_25549 [Arctium lappa]
MQKCRHTLSLTLAKIMYSFNPKPPNLSLMRNYVDIVRSFDRTFQRRMHYKLCAGSERMPSSSATNKIDSTRTYDI